MAYASRAGRAKVSSRNPKAFAVCMRCGIWYNRSELVFQFDWRGSQLQNLFILVCKHCYDRPQEQLRAITLPADPVPIFYPSVEDFANAETDYRAVAFSPLTDPITGLPIQSNDLRTTQDCENRTIIPYGDPLGLDANAVMPQGFAGQGYAAGTEVQYGAVLPVVAVYSSGCLVTVTCSAVHGLQPNNQVAVTGLTNGNGFFSVQVPTATMFTYYTAQPVNPQLTATTRMITCNVGLPRGYTDIPLPYGYTPSSYSVSNNSLELESGFGALELESGFGTIELESGP